MNSNFGLPYSSGERETAQRTFLQRVFLWMFGALGITTVTAVYLSSATDILAYFQENTAMFYGLMILQLVMVLGLSFAINKISAAGAAVMFGVYSVLVGVTFAVLLSVYTTASVVTAFAGATGVFGGMAIWGYTTKKDLSGLGGILFGALLGLIVASIAYIFVGGETLNLIIGWAGVIIFAGLTAYDMQKIKKIGADAMDEETAQKLAIFGALSLYLDFINLVISLLRIFGERR
jgi:uncharacterized protein